MPVELVTKPTAAPITVEEVVEHLRLDSPQPTLIEQFIRAAVRDAERYTRRQIMPAVWRLRIDAFPEDGQPIELPYPPLATVDEFKYIDGTGVEQTLVEDTDFVVDNLSEPGRVIPAFGLYWPTARTFTNVVSIKYTAGYATLDDVPDEFRVFLLNAVGFKYSNREAQQHSAGVQTTFAGQGSGYYQGLNPLIVEVAI